MWRVGWNLEGFARLDGLVRLALDLEKDRALHHICALGARMSVSARAIAGGDFSDCADDIEAGREIHSLQRRALDGGLLLRNGRNDDDRGNDSRDDERFLKHG